MAQATITARVDAKDKTDFDAFCSEVGINTSTAVNMFVKAVLRERKIPFDIAQNEHSRQGEDPFYSAENQAYLMKSINELREGKGSIHELIEVDDE